MSVLPFDAVSSKHSQSREMGVFSPAPPQLDPIAAARRVTDSAQQIYALHWTELLLDANKGLQLESRHAHRLLGIRPV